MNSSSPRLGKPKRRRRGRYHRGTHESPKSGGPCDYRSGWELLLMGWFDAEPSVRCYSYERVKIPYVSNLRSGKTRTYYPDFLVEMVDGTRNLVEVKPAKRLSQSNVVKKLEAARRWCEVNGATLVVITEHELRSMGLL